MAGRKTSGLRLRGLQCSLRLALAVVATLPLGGQTFEVVSVRLDNGDFRPGGLSIVGGPGSADPRRFIATQVPLSMVILKAFDIESDQLRGPEWLTDLANHRYTIQAVLPPEGTTPEQFRQMLQGLLAERFGFKYHWEERQFTGYELSISPRGHNLFRWVAAGEPPPQDDSAGRWREDAEGYPLIPGRANSTLYGYRPGVTSDLKVAVRQPMDKFVKDLERFINFSNGALPNEALPRVVDKTGLSGVYEFKFHFEGTIILGNVPNVADNTSVVGSGPSLFHALEHQLGLLLKKSASVPDRVVVVDHVDRVPSQN